ncbi:hypothetical protein C810_01453 [Lachnospiraceae bacterium A2]|nr:hypothetical protein C810_01453 [Lachnospiraceae bacterium A2]
MYSEDLGMTEEEYMDLWFDDVEESTNEQSKD